MGIPKNRGPVGRPAPARIQAAARDLIERLGIGRTSEILGISREATASIASGCGMRDGTIVLAELNLRKGGFLSDPPSPEAA
jgi:hypothetical protein